MQGPGGGGPISVLPHSRRKKKNCREVHTCSENGCPDETLKLSFTFLWPKRNHTFTPKFQGMGMHPEENQNYLSNTVTNNCTHGTHCAPRCFQRKTIAGVLWMCLVLRGFLLLTIECTLKWTYLEHGLLPECFAAEQLCDSAICPAAAHTAGTMPARLHPQDGWLRIMLFKSNLSSTRGESEILKWSNLQFRQERCFVLALQVHAITQREPHGTSPSLLPERDHPVTEAGKPCSTMESAE